MIFTSQLGMLDGKTEKEAIASIANHLRRMQEELEYRLCVLDSSNITEITAGSTKIKTEDGKDLVNLILGADGAMSALQQTVDGLKVTVNSNQKGISDMQTKFEQTDKDISMVVEGLFKDGKLSAASIVAAINGATGDSIVKIKADRIVMDGMVTVDYMKDSKNKITIGNGDIQSGSVKSFSEDKSIWSQLSNGTLHFLNANSIGAPYTGSIYIDHLTTGSPFVISTNRNLRFDFGTDGYFELHPTVGMVRYDQYGNPY